MLGWEWGEAQSHTHPLPHMLGMSRSLGEPKEGCALQSPRAQEGTVDHLGLGGIPVSSSGGQTLPTLSQGKNPSSVHI